MCQLGQVSRVGFYRYLQARAPIEESMAVRSAIQEIALQHRRRYGYRRVTAELRQRGMIVNHKRVARMMRNDNLLTKRALENGGSLRVEENFSRHATCTSSSRCPTAWRH